MADKKITELKRPYPSSKSIFKNVYARYSDLKNYEDEGIYYSLEEAQNNIKECRKHSFLYTMEIPVILHT